MLKSQFGIKMQRGGGWEGGWEREEGKERERLKNQSPSHSPAGGHQMESDDLQIRGLLTRLMAAEETTCSQLCRKSSTQAWGFQ